MPQEIYEISIRKVDDLSEKAQKEVVEKLSQKPDTFRFKGYAKVIYAKTSPKQVIGVEPIEGTIVDFFKTLTSNDAFSGR